MPIFHFQGFQQVDAFFKPEQFLGIAVKFRGVVRQAVFNFLKFQRHSLQRSQPCSCGGVHAFQVVGGTGEFPQLGAESGTVRFLQHGEHSGYQLLEPCSVAGALPAFLQGEHFLRGESGGVYLVHLVAQQFYFPVGGGFCVLQGVICPARVLPLSPGVRVGLRQPGVFTEGVQQGELPVMGGQGTVVIGAVHVHQAGARLPQKVQRAGAVVQELAVGGGGDNALDDEVAVFTGRHSVFVQNGVDGG